MPHRDGSTIEVLIFPSGGGTVDITSFVVWSQTSFEAQMAAVPGTFTVVCRDIDRELDFTTGAGIVLTVDGQTLFGGYLTQITRANFFSAVDTYAEEGVTTRQWVLNGVDYNILLDKRVLWNSEDPTHQIPKITGSVTDAEIIENYFPSYFDLPGEMTFNVSPKHTYTTGYTWMTQGSTLREVLDNLALWGAVYYIDSDMVLTYLPVQEASGSWGLSDVPNWYSIPEAQSNSTYAQVGYRDGELIEDATAVANHALVWGGSEWANDGAVVFAEAKNTDSIDTHGLWQLAEVHVGEADYKLQAGAQARANVIVSGDEGGTILSGASGLVYPQIQFKATWFAHDVPVNEFDARVHLQAGEVIPVTMSAFALADVLPCRSIRISFPSLKGETGLSYVQFDGFFGILMSDPFWLWAYLRGLRKTSPVVIPTASNESEGATTYGALYQDTPSPTADGVETVFTIPFPYVPKSLQVFDGGPIRRRDVDYTESDPASGEFTFASPPDGPLWVVCYLAG